VERGGTLVLSAGTYRFGSLKMNDDSVLRIADGIDLATVYVDGDVDLGGKVDAQGMPTKRLFVMARSCNHIVVAGEFKGTVLAPKSGISILGGPHEGAFFARNVFGCGSFRRQENGYRTRRKCLRSRDIKGRTVLGGAES
jgi:hypothetical protein